VSRTFLGQSEGDVAAAFELPLTPHAACLTLP
jgi:hypothetical protein